jgi:hypothetical protein
VFVSFAKKESQKNPVIIKNNIIHCNIIRGVKGTIVKVFFSGASVHFELESTDGALLYQAQVKRRIWCDNSGKHFDKRHINDIDYLSIINKHDVQRPN